MNEKKYPKINLKFIEKIQQLLKKAFIKNPITAIETSAKNESFMPRSQK
jgi:hypothetical protein